MSFKSVLKAIFVTPFTSFWKSATGQNYAKAAKDLLSTAGGQVALAVVTNLNPLDLANPLKRDLAFAKIVGIASITGITLATSEINLLIETAVSYLKDRFGKQTVAVAPEVTVEAAKAVADVAVTK